MRYEHEQKKCVNEDRLDDQLDSLREKLRNEQSTLQKAETRIKAGSEQIKTIETLIKQINQIGDEYAEAYPGLKALQCDFEQAYKEENKCLRNILDKRGREEVCCIVNKERGDIETLECKIQGYKNKLDGGLIIDKCKKCGCTCECESSITCSCKCEKCGNQCDCTCEYIDSLRKTLIDQKKCLDKAKEYYEIWVDPIKSIESRLKEIEKVKKEIDKEHAAGNHAYAYYLLVHSKNSFCYHLNREPWVVDPQNLEDKLKDAWNKYSCADESYNDIDGLVKSLEKNLETNQALLIEENKNLEATIQRKLNNNEKCDVGVDCRETEPDNDDKCPNDDNTQT